MSQSKRPGATDLAIVDDREPLVTRLRRAFPLNGAVILLLPSSFMSARRRGLLVPQINFKGGEVTEDPSAATHCVMTPFPVEEERHKHLCIKYGVPDSCEVVPESFLVVGSSSSSTNCRRSRSDPGSRSRSHHEV